MKAKKGVALLAAAAIAVGGAALLAACAEKEPENTFKVDETVYYAVGQSNGPDGSLYRQGDNDNGWQPTVIEKDLTFVRDTTVTDENVFTLKLKMYEGDSFKILHDFEGDWDTVQINISNFGDQMEGEDADRVVKYNNEVCFVTNGAGNANSNIICAEGADGNYTFTMKTYPGTDKDPVLSVVKDGSIPRLTKMYVNSDINDYGHAPNKGEYNMTNSNGTWSFIITVTADDLVRDADGEYVETDKDNKPIGGVYTAIQIKNLGGEPNEQKIFTATPGADDLFKKATDETEGAINLIPEGKWMIVFNQTTKAVTISEMAYEMYFIGDFNSWKQADADYTLTVGADGTTWTGVLEITADMIPEGKETIGVKLFNAKGASDADKYLPGGFENPQYGVGKYFFKFDAGTNEIKSEKFEYYLVGSYTDPSWGDGLAAEKSSKLELGEDGKYTLTIELAAGAQVKVVYGVSLSGANHASWGWANGENLTTETAGTYVITHDAETQNSTIAVKA